MPNCARTPGRFRARKARGRDCPKGNTSQGPSGCRSRSMAWKTGVLDRIQRPSSCGPSNRSLPSVGLSFPVSQPRSSPWVSVEPYWRAFLKGGCLGVRVTASGSERVKITPFLQDLRQWERGAQGSPSAHLPARGSGSGRPRPAVSKLGPRVVGPQPCEWREIAGDRGPEEGDMAHCCMRAQDDRDPTPAAVTQKRHRQGA